MKKIVSFILIILVLYIVGIFIFPDYINQIGEKLGLSSFNQSVINFKTDIEKSITDYDPVGKVNQTKQQAIEIKQKMETQVQETKQKIETIQTKVDNVEKSIDNTTKAVNQTVNSLNDLTNSVSNVISSTGSGN
ncbi:MAG: hypothetical protein PHE25_03820 [Candidatus Gracilibacteria bacterium]|nr:hypothetical protein [Candidatus Gracilibacteria bacterium]